MIDITELDKLKARLGIIDDKQDNKLSVLLEDAEDEALGYTNRDKILPGMLGSIRELAVIKFNIDGNEGETSRTEGGVSQTFEMGIPKNIKSKLNRYRLGHMRSLK